MMGYVAKHDWPKIFINRTFGLSFGHSKSFKTILCHIEKCEGEECVLEREGEIFQEK